MDLNPQNWQMDSNKRTEHKATGELYRVTTITVTPVIPGTYSLLDLHASDDTRVSWNNHGDMNITSNGAWLG